MAFKRTVTLRASFQFPAIRFDAPTLLSFSGFTYVHAKCPPVDQGSLLSMILGKIILINLTDVYRPILKVISYQSNYALKHMHQLRSMASTLRMRKTISLRQWQPWTAVSPLLGQISMS